MTVPIKSISQVDKFKDEDEKRWRWKVKGCVEAERVERRSRSERCDHERSKRKKRKKERKEGKKHTKGSVTLIQQESITSLWEY